MKRSLMESAARGRTTWKRLFRSTAAAGLLSLLVIGCAGSLDPGVGGGGGASGGMGGATGNGCEAAIFSSKCMACHSTAGPSGGLDLQAANIAARVVGKPTAAISAGGSCSGKTLINATSNPATGVFIDKITLLDGDPTLCGSAMPLGQMLSSTQISCLTAWAASVDTMTFPSPSPSSDEAP